MVVYCHGAMTVTLHWEDYAQELRIIMEGEVSLTEIAEHIPKIRSHLDRATTRVDVIHDLTKLESLKIQWAILPSLMQKLRHPNIGRAIYVRPRPFLEWVARFTGR